MRITFPLTLSVLVASTLAQTTVLPNGAPRAAASVIAGSDLGAPSLRMWGGSATDGTSMFVFGGRTVDTAGNAGSVYYNGLDAYNPTTNSWTNLSAEGEPTAPSNRFRPAFAYDPMNDRVVVFGGLEDPTGTVYSDCFAFDLTTNTWSAIPNPTPGTTGPSARFDSKMAYDAALGSLILFGGQGPGGNGDRYDDTWLLSGGTWAPLTPATSPSARAIFAMTERSAPYGDIVLLGGRDTANAIQNDTWRWNGAALTWESITAINSTVPVTFGGGNDAVYVSVRQVVSVINGTGTGVAPSNTTAAGSWTSEYDCVTNEWRAYGSSLTNQAGADPLIGRCSASPAISR
jgi:hypothetical protein